MFSSNLILPWVSNSLFAVGIFYLLTLILTLAGFPFCLYFFKKKRDLGIPFARIISLILVTYLAWIGGSFKIIPFTQISLFIILLIFVLFSIYLISRKRFLKNYLLLFLQEELVFLIFFITLIVIRYGNPDLWHPVMGGEKPMDFAFLNSLIRTKYFPPLDPWFAQGFINYYYFGTLLVATLVKLTSILPSIAYNIVLAFIFAQSAASIYSIIYNQSKSFIKSFATCILGLVAGNLAQLSVIIKNFSSLIPINSWYWNASRVMSNGEINEFPFFSFIYADLHAHLISLCIALLIIAIGLSLFDTLNSKIITLIKVIGIAFFIGIIRMSNTWDFPTYVLFSVLVLLFCYIYSRTKKFTSVLYYLFLIIILIILSSFFIVPFISSYHVSSLGISLYHGSGTSILDYLKIHGLFIWILVGYLLSLIISHRSSVKSVNRFIPLLLFTFAIGLTIIPEIFDSTLALGRMNTVFKFYFQAWLFYTIASGLSFDLIFRTLKRYIPNYFNFWRLCFILLFVVALLYPLTATPAKIKDRMNVITPKTLDGMEYMKYSTYFDNGQKLNLEHDYNAINWINQNISGQPVILEAQTPFYRWGSRVSVYTGLPTLIGWEWHETAHRAYLKNGEISLRINDVATAYNTPSVNIFKNIVDKYQIKYIYIGELETAYYQSEGLAKFNQLNGNYLKLIYRNNDTIIYQVIN